MSLQRINRAKLVPVALLVALVTACASVPSHEPHVVEPSYTESLVVVIKDPRSERQRSNLSGPAYRNRVAYHEDPVLHRYAARIASDHQLRIVEEWPIKNLGVHCFLVNPEASSNIAKLERDERVLWVQPFNEFEVKSSRSSNSFSSAGLKRRFMDEFSARGRSIRVAVVDTAVDRHHPDFHNSSLRVKNFSGTRGQPLSEKHGTAVVGLIAANPASVDGVQGIAPEASTHLLRGCWQDKDHKGRCNTLTLALALDAAIELEPDVLNLSLSGGQDRVLDALIDELIEQGTLVVAAYDDDRDAHARFPSSRPGVIYAFGRGDSHSVPMLEHVLAAPRDAVSLAPMAGYDLISGHSIAAPQLSAMAAVLMETYRFDEREDIVRRLDLWLREQWPEP